LSFLLETVALNYLGRHSVSKAPSFFEILPMGPLRRVPDAERFWVTHLADSYRGRIFASVESDSAPVFAAVGISENESVEKLKRWLRVTEQAILQACWLIVLHRHFGTVPVLGIVVSGRT